jgi:hypothetical protein
MTHAIPLGTRLLLTLPFTPELLAGDEYEPFCPGITGTVECWVIGHTPLDSDDAEPEYTICPYKSRQTGGQPMWEFLAEVDANLVRKTDGYGMDYRQWFNMAILELSSHRIARGIPERLLLPFVQKD